MVLSVTLLVLLALGYVSHFYFSLIYRRPSTLNPSGRVIGLELDRGTFRFPHQFKKDLRSNYYGSNYAFGFGRFQWNIPRWETCHYYHLS